MWLCPDNKYPNFDSTAVGPSISPHTISIEVRIDEDLYIELSVK